MGATGKSRERRMGEAGWFTMFGEVGEGWVKVTGAREDDGRGGKGG